jgi:hypothetical protein
MTLTESDFTIKLTRRELTALALALKELTILQGRLPDERNGFDRESQMISTDLRDRIFATLEI